MNLTLGNKKENRTFTMWLLHSWAGVLWLDMLNNTRCVTEICKLMVGLPDYLKKQWLRLSVSLP